MTLKTRYRHVWYVQGDEPEATLPTLFDTQLAAEIYARHRFPDEHPDTRYARIYCREVWTEAELKKEN